MRRRRRRRMLKRKLEFCPVMLLGMMSGDGDTNVPMGMLSWNGLIATVRVFFLTIIMIKIVIITITMF